MTVPAVGSEMPDGRPRAAPFYLVDASGNPLYNCAEQIMLASAAITANSNTVDLINNGSRGIKLYLATGAFGSGATAITVTLAGKDPVSLNYFTMLTSVSLSASSFVVLTVYPGLTASANVTANDVLPHTWRVTWQASAWGTGGSTLGISAALLL